MPEGDTIFRTAAALRAVLAGRPVVAARGPARAGRVRVPDLAPTSGSTIEAVEARGKHLVMRFSSGFALHTHLGMSGSWHRYAAGERWQRPARQAAVVLEVPGAVAVCFNPATVELLDDRALGRHAALNALGPDLLAADFDASEAVRRLRQRSGVSVAEALLDQRALAGIGNVYRSELLFLAGVHPSTPVDRLDAATLDRLVADAARLLRANSAGGAPVDGCGSTAVRAGPAVAAGRGSWQHATVSARGPATGAPAARRRPRLGPDYSSTRRMEAPRPTSLDSIRS